jgi:chromosome condensin MukBEF ATPase and DNA-binding subunit MukB
MTNLEREVGALDARMENVEKEIHAMRTDVRQIRDAVLAVQGGWKAIAMISGASAAIGALIVKLLPFFFTLPR